MLGNFDKIKPTKTILSRVGYILQEYPETRVCDKKLYISYLGYFHDLKAKFYSGWDYYEFVKFLLDEAPGFETIRRNRQHWNQRGKFIRKVGEQ